MKKYDIIITVFDGNAVRSNMSPNFLYNLIVAISSLKARNLKEYTVEDVRFVIDYNYNTEEFTFFQENLNRKYIIPWDKVVCANLTARIQIPENVLNQIIALYRIQKEEFNPNEYFNIVELKREGIYEQ